jgi:ABC-type uncharacterized transport system permease subunit
MANDHDREIGKLIARMDGIEDWAKSLDNKLSDIAKSMKTIEIEFAQAKGSARVAMGIAAIIGGIVAFIVEHALFKKFF